MPAAAKETCRSTRNCGQRIFINPTGNPGAFCNKFRKTRKEGATADNDKTTQVAFRLAVIRRKRLEAKATLALSFAEDIPMGAVAWYRIQNVDGGSQSTLLMFFTSVL